MEKADYRKIFQQMMKSNSGIAIDPILKKHGISTGNFYYFMAHEDVGDRTMSIKNLEILYQEFTDQGMVPTNRARLEAMDTKSMVKELFANFDFTKADIKEKDVTKWMNSFVGSEFKKK